MKFSLLNKIPDNYAECRVIYDLSIDRAIKEIVDDKRRAEYFLSVLEKPLTKRENIIFRQEIYSDLKNIDGLLPALKIVRYLFPSFTTLPTFFVNFPALYFS